MLSRNSIDIRALKLVTTNGYDHSSTHISDGLELKESPKQIMYWACVLNYLLTGDSGSNNKAIKSRICASVKAPT